MQCPQSLQNKRPPSPREAEVYPPSVGVVGISVFPQAPLAQVGSFA